MHEWLEILRLQYLITTFLKFAFSKTYSNKTFCLVKGIGHGKLSPQQHRYSAKRCIVPAPCCVETVGIQYKYPLPTPTKLGQ